jgi:hypothetical protein
MRHIIPVIFAAVVSGCGGSKTSGTTPTNDMSASADLSSGGDLSDGVCHFPNGDVCDPVIGCSNGCAWCGCTIEGTSTHGVASCNENECDPGDSGAVFAAPCATSADCAGGLVCVFSIGCTQTMGQCTPAGACDSVGIGMPPVGSVTFCDCTNHTVTATTTCGIPQQYAHTGGCG